MQTHMGENVQPNKAASAGLIDESMSAAFVAQHNAVLATVAFFFFLLIFQPSTVSFVNMINKWKMRRGKTLAHHHQPTAAIVVLPGNERIAGRERKKI